MRKTFVFAVMAGHSAAASILLPQKGVDPNVVHNMQTPLAMASIRGHNDIVKLLLEDDRVQVHQGDLFGLNAIHYAIRNGRIGASFFH